MRRCPARHEATAPDDGTLPLRLPSGQGPAGNQRRQERKSLTGRMHSLESRGAGFESCRAHRRGDFERSLLFLNLSTPPAFVTSALLKACADQIRHVRDRISWIFHDSIPGSGIFSIFRRWHGWMFCMVTPRKAGTRSIKLTGRFIAGFIRE